MVEFALTLPILLLLMFGIIEFGRIFQAWVTIQNAARTAIRYAVTGQYDASTFDLDHDWDPNNLASKPGIPCPYTDTDPKQATFKAHWDNIACNPGNDDHYWMRRDIVRMYTIYQTARVGAAGLALNNNGPDIPGTGFGSQTRAELLTKLKTERGWFHVWICSSRVTLQDTDVNGKPYARYTQGDQGADKTETDGTKFGQCQVAENTSPIKGNDQYDPGGPGDFVQIIVYFNHPLITPLGLQSTGFITLQARRVAVNESYRTAKVINITDQGSGATSIAPPRLQKEFNPVSMPLNNGTSTLKFTIINTNPTTDLVNVEFTDPFPPAASGQPAILSTGNPTQVGAACPVLDASQQPGGVGIHLKLAKIPANTTCIFNVPVKTNSAALAAGVDKDFVNTTTAITSDNGGAGSPASATFSITGPASIVKSFSSPTTVTGTPVTMTLTIHNPNAIALTGTVFTDVSPGWPAGMQVASTPNINNACNLTLKNQSGGAFAGGATGLQVTGGTIPASSDCVLSFDVVGATAGTTYTNTVSAVTTVEGGAGNCNAPSVCTASFQVLNGLQAKKEFKASDGTTDIDNAGINQVVKLRFTIWHTNTGNQATGVGFTDTLPSGMVVATPNNLTGPTGCGSDPGLAVTFPAANQIKLDKAKVDQGTNCTFTVDVVASAPGNLTNGPVTVSSNNMGTATMSDTLNVLNPPGATKSFTPDVVAPNTKSVLQINISNSNSVNITGANFTDTFPSGLVVASTQSSGLPANNCGGTLTATAGANSVSLTGATVPTAGCFVKVEVQGPAGVYNNNVTVNSAFGSSPQASATLTVAAPPTIKIGFNANTTDPSVVDTGDGPANATIGTGGTVEFTVVITNPNPAGSGINITSIDFTDVLSGSGNQVRTTTTTNGGANATATNSCGLSLVTNRGTNVLPGARWFRYTGSGLSIGPGQTCVVSISKVWSNTVGSYPATIPAGVTPGNGTAGFAYQMTGMSTASNSVGSNPAKLDVVSGLVATKLFDGKTNSSIAINGTSTLTIKIDNPLSVAASNVSFTDNFPSGIKIANGSATTLTGTGCTGGTISPGNVTNDTSIKLTGLTIAAGGSCTITAVVTGSAPGDYPNTIAKNAVTSSNGSNAVATTATLTIIAGPQVTKTVSGPIIIGQPAPTLTFTITNPNSVASGYTLTNVSFTDTFPGNIVVANPPGLSVTGCGSGSVTDLSGGTVTAGDNGIKLTNGSIAPNSSCTISVKITASNNTPSATNNNVVVVTSNVNPNCPNVNAPQCQDQVNIPVQIQAPTADKQFNGTNSTVTILPNGTAQLVITVTNPSTINYTNLTITDNLPTGSNGGQLSVSMPPNPTTTCSGGTLTQANGTGLANGSTSIKLSGASLAAGASCTITLTVKGVTAGTYNNVTTAPQADNTGAGTPSPTRTLVVLGPPNADKSFSPDPITVGQTSTLTIHIINPNPSTQLTGVSFTDNFPASSNPTGGQMQVASSPGVTNSGCGTPTITANPGSTSLSVSNVTIAGGGTCTITIKVTGTTRGTYANAITQVNSSNGGNNTNPGANDTLTVNALSPTITKAFSPTAIAKGGTSTVTLVITNPNPSGQSLTGVTFTDTLPTNLNFASTLNFSSTCGLTQSISGQKITLSGGTIAGGNATCTVKFDVTSNTAGSYNNTTSGVDSNESAVGNVSNTATLNVNGPPTISKSFSPSSVTLGASSVLTITVHNGGTAQQTGVSFSDAFPSISGGQMQVASTPGFSATGCGSASFSGNTAGSTSLSMSNGTIAAGGDCIIKINVVGTKPGTYPNTTGAPSSNEGGTGSPSSTVNLTVTNPNPPQVSKSFSPGSITDGGASTLTLNITNPSSNAVTLTGVAISDNLGANGLKVANPPNASTTCTGGSVSGGTAGSTSISLSGASIPANSSCTVTVSVTNANSVTSQTTLTNVTGQVTASGTNLGPISLTGNTATAQLVVNPVNQPVAPSISKNFLATPPNNRANYTTQGSPIRLRFVITNSNATQMTGVTFSDTMPANSDLKVATTAQLTAVGISAQPFTSTGCGSLSGTPASGATSFTLTNITIAANSSCTIDVYVVALTPNYTANGGSPFFTNQTGNVSAGTLVGNKASDTVQIDPSGGAGCTQNCG